MGLARYEGKCQSYEGLKNAEDGPAMRAGEPDELAGSGAAAELIVLARRR
jgi:hypothetical protein